MAAAANLSTDRRIVLLEREAEIITIVPGLIRHRHAYFLSPVDISGQSPLPEMISSGTSSFTTPVNFPGWRPPPKNWKAWTDSMHSLHRSEWKEAGICEAILNSCYTIPKNEDLIFGFAEKWCPETNTFVFPWGEATLTLEDMAVIGSYSVFGGPVFSSVENTELKRVQAELESERRRLSGRSHKVLQTRWMERFMNSRSHIEHEAFLIMWLSRFVFPMKSQGDTISSRVLALAVILASGTRIALAPAVLAGIYASLSEIKDVMAKPIDLATSVSAPLQLLQVWIWERFLVLRPNPVVHELHSDQPWFARWESLRYTCPSDIPSLIYRSGGHFLWRPYCSVCSSRVYYKDRADIVFPDSGLVERVEMLIKCLRYSELVGIDSSCIKVYLPHRVARQFGYDQDVPGSVSRADSSQIVAWDSYSRGIGGEMLYIPPGMYEAGITTRYAIWWSRGAAESSRQPEIPRNLEGIDITAPPPGFPHKRLRDPPIPGSDFQEIREQRVV